MYIYILYNYEQTWFKARNTYSVFCFSIFQTVGKNKLISEYHWTIFLSKKVNCIEKIKMYNPPNVIKNVSISKICIMPPFYPVNEFHTYKPHRKYCKTCENK